MAELGLTVMDIGTTLQVALTGNDDSKYREGSYEHPIRIALDKFDRTNIDDVGNLSFTNVIGKQIQLAQFAEIYQTTGPTKLERQNRNPSAVVSAFTDGTIPNGSVVAQFEKDFNNNVTGGTKISYEGDDKLRSEGMDSLMLALIAAITFVYFIMVLLFDSFIYPFIDRDNAFNEDPLNGADDDGDGLIDEDFPGLRPLHANIFVDWNDDGIWNEAGTSLKIIISPPWWSTWWSYILYGFVMVIVLTLSTRIYLNRQRLNTQLVLEHDHALKLEEVDKMKSNFYANISHEFRTPLMLILGPAEKIVSKLKDEDGQKQIGLIKGNAKRLLNLINQLLDLSRLEAGRLKLNGLCSSIVASLHL